MNLVPLSQLFEVSYGVNLEMNRMTPDPEGVPFVSRSDRNNGVTGRVARVEGVDPLPAGSITVAGGGSVMAAFVQPEAYYSGRDLYYLVPRVPMTLRQKLFYCACIKANRYRYSYGRQANRTLASIEVPALADLPAWVAEPEHASPLDDMRAAVQGVTQRLAKPAPVPATPTPGTAASVPLSQLFEVQAGHSLELNRLTPNSGGVAFVARSRRNNGVTGRVARIEGVDPMPAGNITVAGSGNSVMAAFVQEEPYYSGFHLFTLVPRVPMTLRQKLFYCACITANRYRFSYGRQANRSIRSIELPALHTLPAWLDTAGDGTLQELQETMQRVDGQLAPAAQAQVAKPKRARKPAAPAAPAAAPAPAAAAAPGDD